MTFYSTEPPRTLSPSPDSSAESGPPAPLLPVPPDPHKHARGRFPVARFTPDASRTDG